MAYKNHQCKNIHKVEAERLAIVCPMCQKTVIFTGKKEQTDEIWQKHYLGDCNPENYKKVEQEKKSKKCQFNNNKRCKNELNEVNSFNCSKCKRLLCSKHRGFFEHQCEPYKKIYNQLQNQNQSTMGQIKQQTQKLGDMFKNLITRENKPQNKEVQFTESQRAICHVCGKSFDDYMQLISHAESVHYDNQVMA
ncbi:hypothetical protein PPERSA_00309 [Pseudocohnilembus persalinus]|uniref:C2H2-type domain-containing protein n=1 Tax=Pseudocohnilembus persalinus TaxID=266149 RepID=A0A0V0Q975_PSEPJ|nr:hypothetical protein PPERSA_00309 [Pseudocohnilembus persalinus]|eukprot:KRW98721.1 hypothetical protein PPERSA_00309 [Pseudocohnilembus persalinus]